MKVGYLQNIQSFETSAETGNLQSYEKQTAVKVTLQLEQIPSPPPPPPHATVIDYCPDGTITIVTLS